MSCVTLAALAEAMLSSAVEVRVHCYLKTATEHLFQAVACKHELA